MVESLINYFTKKPQEKLKNVSVPHALSKNVHKNASCTEDACFSFQSIDFWMFQNILYEWKIKQKGKEWIKIFMESYFILSCIFVQHNCLPVVVILLGDCRPNFCVALFYLNFMNNILKIKINLKKFNEINFCWKQLIFYLVII